MSDENGHFRPNGSWIPLVLSAGPATKHLKRMYPTVRENLEMYVPANKARSAMYSVLEGTNPSY